MRKAGSLWLALVAGAATAAVAPGADPAAQISQQDSASEYWDLMARFESGHRLVWRFLITNEGPGERTASAVGRLVDPDGTITKFRNGRRKGDWTLDEEGLALRIGSSRLDLRAPTRHFAFDSTKQGVKIDLRIHAGDPGVPGAAAADYRVDLLDLSAPIEGTVWVRGMETPLTLRGRAALTHTWMDWSEADLARRRFDFASLEGDTALVFYDLTSPGGTRLRHLAIAKKGKILYESNDFEVSLGGTAAAWDHPAYPIPATLQFRNEEVSGRIRLDRVLLEHEPLKDLPQPFRFLLSLKMRPRRVWADSPYELNLNAGPGRASLQVRGTGMASVTYLNPLRSQASTPPQRVPEPDRVRVGLINNLRAGRSDRQVARILNLLRDYPDVLHVETDQAGALPDAIADLSRRQVDLLVVNGGDGTLQHTLTEILTNQPFRRVPMIAPLRGGRTNMTALDLGAQRDPVRGLKELLEAAQSGRIHERVADRPVLRIAFDQGRRVQYGMFFGAGMIHRAIALTHRVFPKGRSQGSFGAGVVTLSLIAKTLFRPREGVMVPDKVQVVLDGELVKQGEFILTISTSLQRLFWRINPFWGEGVAPVRFTCISSGPKRFAAAAPGVLRGRPRPFVQPEAGYSSRNVERADLFFDCGFTIDGEVFAPRAGEQVTLTGDRRLTFVRA